MRISLAGIFLILLNTALFSQDQKLSISVQFGPVFNNINLNNQPNAEYKYGFDYIVGFSGEFYFSKNVGLQFGLAFENKNIVIDYESHHNSSMNVGRQEIKFEYLTIPILVKINLISGKKYLPYILSGISWSKQTYQDYKVYRFNGELIEYYDDRYTLDQNFFQLNLGVGFQYNILNDLGIRLESIFRYAINEIQSNPHYMHERYSIIIQAGLFYNLVSFK